MNAKEKVKQKEYRSKLNDLDLEARDKQEEHMKNYREGYGDKSELDAELKALHSDIAKRKTALHAEYYGSKPQGSVEPHWFYR